jgi:hypothetical protein
VEIIFHIDAQNVPVLLRFQRQVSSAIIKQTAE